MQHTVATANARPAAQEAADAAQRILGNEHSQLYVGASAARTDEEFDAESLALPANFPWQDLQLTDGMYARVAITSAQPMALGSAQVMLRDEDQHVAELYFGILCPANERQMWEPVQGQQEPYDEVFLFFFLMLHCASAAFSELGPVALIWQMQFRPSAALSGTAQARIFKAFIDGLRRQFKVGLAVMRQDNHSAPLLLTKLGATLRFGGTFYTPLGKDELEAAGAPGKCLIAHGCWRTPEEPPAQPAVAEDSLGYHCAQT